MKIVLMLAVSFILDIIFKDPKYLPHPVVFIGRLISYLEKAFMKIFRRGKTAEYISGVVLSVTVIFISFIIPFFILSLLYSINFYLGAAVEIFLCFQILALGSLKEACMQVYNYLALSQMDKARKSLSYIITRDTSNMDEKDMVKAVVETASENTSDGVTAPLFYMMIGGASLGMLYKAVNTLDSMTGYKTEKYIYRGRFAAKLDDILNYIPARITGCLYVAAAFLSGLNYKNAYKILKRDCRKHESPNSAYLESAAAGALGIQLGGPAVYFGKMVDKSYIGDSLKEPDIEDIPKVSMLMYIVSFLGFIFFAAVKFILLYIAGL